MLWQDIVLVIVGIVFFVSLLPQVVHGFKEKVGPIQSLTSVPTFLGLYVSAVIYLTLSLYFSAILLFFIGTLWLLLFIQRLLYHKR